MTGIDEALAVIAQAIQQLQEGRDVLIRQINAQVYGPGRCDVCGERLPAQHTCEADGGMPVVNLIAAACDRMRVTTGKEPQQVLLSPATFDRYTAWMNGGVPVQGVCEAMYGGIPVVVSKTMPNDLAYVVVDMTSPRGAAR
jgi:hypothetical protein